MNVPNEEYNEALMLNKILEYPNESSTFVEDFIRCMKIFYAKNRAHSYYEVAKWVDSQENFELGGFLDAIDQISFAISEQRNSNNQEEKTFYLKMLRKLSDHIKLEVFREEKEADLLRRTEEAEAKLNEVMSAANEVLSKQEDSQKTIENSLKLSEETIDVSKQFKDQNDQLVKEIKNTKKESTNATKKLNKATKKLDSAEMGYISTLGIFAGIVMAFAGVFSFTSSAFENISSLNFWMLCFLLAITVFGLVNLIYWLFHCVGILLQREKPYYCKNYKDERQTDNKQISFKERDCSNCCKRNECGKLKKGWVHLDSTYIVVCVICVILIMVLGFITSQKTTPVGYSNNFGFHIVNANYNHFLI